MKIKVANYISQFLVDHGVTDAFSVVGGGAMHLNDAFGHQEGLHTTYNHHEQACAIAAEAYARLENKIALVCVTSGPGGINALTGVCGGWLDSIPMFIVSGQVKYTTTSRYAKTLNPEINLRSLGDQEYDIVKSVEPMTKYAVMIEDPMDIRYACEKAWHLATTGRPGPVLIDIPIDIQQNEIEKFEYPETVNIIGYKPNTKGHIFQVKRAVEAIKNCKRPIIVSGGGVLSSGVKPKFQAFAEKTGIPVISTMMGIGVMPSEHELYLGMLGTHGKPAANRALHEADLVIVCGARLGDRAVAAPDQMSKRTTVIHIDIDPAEIGKNVKTAIPIVGDMMNVMDMLNENIGDYKVQNQWSEAVKTWKKDLFREPPKFDGYVEPRTLVGHLSAMFRSKAILVADVGQNQIWCANNFRIREGRFLTTGGMGTMGYSVPAAIGAKFARPNRDVLVVCGDGSFQMQLNELATIAGNNLNIKIIIMRNSRLGMVRELQDNHYGHRHSATILEGDPDFLKIAEAYGIDHAEANSNEQAEEIIKHIVDSDKPFILVCDVYPDTPSI